MKKVFYTIILSCFALMSTAQFTIISEVNAPDEGESWEMSNLTNNMGIAYNLDDKTMIGVYKNGDDYDVFARHTMRFGFVCVEAPTNEMMDNMDIGFGSNINIYKNLFVTPMYLMPFKEDSNGVREGSFKLGVSYKI
jgi:hypothetical protein